MSHVFACNVTRIRLLSFCTKCLSHSWSTRQDELSKWSNISKFSKFCQLCQPSQPSPFLRILLHPSPSLNLLHVANLDFTCTALTVRDDPRCVSSKLFVPSHFLFIFFNVHVFELLDLPETLPSLDHVEYVPNPMAVFAVVLELIFNCFSKNHQLPCSAFLSSAPYRNIAVNIF